MSSFDTLFFEQHIARDEKIEKVFHRHVFVMLEDLLVWIFFGLIIPGFLYYYDVFEMRTFLDPSYVYGYMFLIYFVLLYKIFDWYLDVWILSNETLVEMSWKSFTPQMSYTAYEKIEGIEVRTHSWFYSMLGISDVSINLAGSEVHTLLSVADPKDLLSCLQEKTKEKHGEEEHKEEDKEPFDILVDALSGVVKDHLSIKGKDYLTKDYVEKLDSTLTRGISIDLRSDDEKEAVESWKKRHHAENIDHDHGHEH